jgi:hypothetical protein
MIPLDGLSGATSSAATPAAHPLRMFPRTPVPPGALGPVIIPVE